jgi:hypothetical protein
MAEKPKDTAEQDKPDLREELFGASSAANDSPAVQGGESAPAPSGGDTTVDIPFENDKPKGIDQQAMADAPLGERFQMQTVNGSSAAAAEAEVRRQVDERQIDETVEGGRYRVGDTMYSAVGKPLKNKEEGDGAINA